MRWPAIRFSVNLKSQNQLNLTQFVFLIIITIFTLAIHVCLFLVTWPPPPPFCCCVKQYDYWRAVWNANVNLPWWSIRSFKQWLRCLAHWVQQIHILISKNLALGASVLWEDLALRCCRILSIMSSLHPPPPMWFDTQWWVHGLEGWGLSGLARVPLSLFQLCERTQTNTADTIVAFHGVFQRKYPK